MTPTVDADLRRRLRSWWKTFWLNPFFTGAIDRFSPALPLGAKGERIAVRYLKRKGHVIVHTGYNDGYGEIDIISVEQRTVVFTEVKTRTAAGNEEAFAAVDAEKQLRISQTAMAYLNRHHLLEQRVRFDVIAIALPSERSRPELEHVKAAFEAHC